MILISHGSGGIGINEKSLAKFFIKAGFKVGIIDYFSRWGIEKLYWGCRTSIMDNHSVTFNEMFETPCLDFNEKIVHIGCSLGGTFGLHNSKKFFKNYCFYPGILGYTKEMLLRDYSNTTVIIAEHDTWCDNYYNFESQCHLPPNKIIAEGTFHGFMIPKKDNVIPVAKHTLGSYVISEKDYVDLQPNFQYISSIYDYEEVEIKLKHNKEKCIEYRQYILKDIMNAYNNIIT